MQMEGVNVIIHTLHPLLQVGDSRSILLADIGRGPHFVEHAPHLYHIIPSAI